jgi:hypothetical protein
LYTKWTHPSFFFFFFFLSKLASILSIFEWQLALPGPPGVKNLRYNNCTTHTFLFWNLWVILFCFPFSFSNDGSAWLLWFPFCLPYTILLPVSSWTLLTGTVTGQWPVRLVLSRHSLKFPPVPTRSYIHLQAAALFCLLLFEIVLFFIYSVSDVDPPREEKYGHDDVPNLNTHSDVNVLLLPCVSVVSKQYTQLLFFQAFS